jgi:hypothetical protein
MKSGINMFITEHLSDIFLKSHLIFKKERTYEKAIFIMNKRYWWLHKTKIISLILLAVEVDLKKLVC